MNDFKRSRCSVILKYVNDKKKSIRSDIIWNY
jgi:hypothetical protein